MALLSRFLQVLKYGWNICLCKLFGQDDWIFQQWGPLACGTVVAVQKHAAGENVGLIAHDLYAQYIYMNLMLLAISHKVIIKTEHFTFSICAREKIGAALK